jgi:hypothetical protein
MPPEGLRRPGAVRDGASDDSGVAGAAARALLAMIVVPFRCRVAELGDE